jgi:hypothetical protein
VEKIAHIWKKVKNGKATRNLKLLMNQIKHNKNYKKSLSKNSSLKPLIFKTI